MLNDWYVLTFKLPDSRIEQVFCPLGYEQAVRIAEKREIPEKDRIIEKYLDKYETDFT